MRGKVPHIVQYQGSKRILAPQILQYMPVKIDRLIEPFSGMAAISIATAYEGRAEEFLINDLNAPLINMLQEAVERPQTLIEDYSSIWEEQFTYGEEHVQHFYDVRDRFNNGEKTPANMLYLLARCVKGAVRYGKNGNFNQSPDKRRHGTNPRTLASNVYEISHLLKGKAKFKALDYHFMLLSPSANRAKSWTCEHCKNWDTKDVNFCMRCFWAYPEDYDHVAGKPEKMISIIFSGNEIAVRKSVQKEFSTRFNFDMAESQRSQTERFYDVLKRQL